MEIEKNFEEYSENLICEGEEMTYLKIFPDVEQLFEPFTKDQKWDLVQAMMDYAFRGDDTEFQGVERFAWPALRRIIDQCNAVAETKRNNGLKGGRPKTKANLEEPNETKDNLTKPRMNFGYREEPNESFKEKEKEKEYEYEKENEKEKEYKTRAREVNYTDDSVIGIDGTDLRADIERNQIADGLILRYRLSRDDVTREALIADLTQYGEKRMREVLNEAASSNKFERISVKFWRAILTNSKPSQKRDYQTRNYTEADLEDGYVNLDDADEHGRLPGEPGYGT